MKKYEVEGLVIADESSFDTFNRFDMGLNLGLGIEYRNYNIGAAYQVGFIDVEKDVMSWHELFRISVGYRFRNK